MIRLIFKIRGQTLEKSFSQPTVTIGAESLDIEGLPLDAVELDREHLKFVNQNGDVYAINEANDPFVTLNGRPFGRKKLSDGDRLEIGEMEILYIGAAGSLAQKSLSEVLEQKIQASAPRPPSQESEDDLSTLIAQVERLEDQEEVAEEPSPVIIHQNTAFTHERRREPQSSGRWRVQEETSEHYEEESYQNRGSIWGSVIAYVSILLAIIAAVGSGVYFTFSEQSDTQEFVVAEGLADISMAFIYAHQYQIKPVHQNWSSGEFINEILGKILPEELTSYALLDGQNNFTNADYLLRAYLTPDLSRFLLMAQPKPTFLQWILPRETLLIDSQSLELRRTTDLKELNRLLANPNPLDGANAVAVFNLVNQADLVRLSTLAQETGHIEFNPPSNLSHVRLAATSLVYNAPRYYLLGQPLILALAGGTSQEGEEQRALEDLVRSWRGFPNLVLYARDNKELANRAFKVLKERFPQDTFLVGYLGPTSDTSTILTAPLPYHEPLDPYLYDFQGEHASTILEAAAVVPDKEAERLRERKRELKPLSKQIKQWLDIHTAISQSDFYERLSALLQTYQERDLGFQKNSSTKLLALASMSETGENSEGDENSNQEASDITQEKFQTFSEQIQEAKTFSQLQSVVREIALWVQTTQPLMPARFAALSNKLQAQSLRRLEYLLFSPASSLLQEDLHPSQRIVVQSILIHLGVDDPYQRDYYLKEFDLLVERN